MSWTKIDDGILTHPKMQEAEELCPVFAWVLWSKALVYVNQHKLNGRVTKKIAARLVGAKHAAAAIKALVESRLWDEDGDDWSFHDFEENNLTKEARADKAKRNAENQAAYRERQRLEREAEAAANAESSKPSVSAYGLESKPSVSDNENVSKDVSLPSRAGADAPACARPPVPSRPVLSPPVREEQHTRSPDDPSAAAPEAEVLSALSKWPVLAPVATLEWVRAVRASAAGAGWSQADVLTGIAEFGQKRGASVAVAGALDVDRLSDALVGFIKSAHTKRRSTPKPGEDLTPEQVQAIQAKRGVQQGSAGPAGDGNAMVEAMLANGGVLPDAALPGQERAKNALSGGALGTPGSPHAQGPSRPTLVSGGSR
ncbi:hypothetical protein K0U83_17475 [bacterium]|nr:hypothetical protein [bacterium]